MSFPLTKSHFLAGLQCPKRLWLAVCKPEYASPVSLSQQRGLQANQQFRAMVQRRFQGIAISGALHSALEQTQILLQEGQECLFEAAFIFDDIFLRAHILRRRPSRGWQLLEGKPALKIEEEYVVDLALQDYVLNGSGIELTQIGLILPRPESEEEPPLILMNLTQRVQARQSQIPEYLAQFRRYLAQSEPPPIPMGNHCDHPYLCPFKAHCQGEIFPISLFPEVSGSLPGAVT